MIDFDFKVTLRPFDSIHLDQARQWRNHIKVWAWCRQNTLISQSEQQSWYEKLLGDDSVKMFSIYDTNEIFVGVCGFTSIDHLNQRAEFSLYIGPEHRRKGHADAALMTLFTHGFMDLGLNCIWGETFEDNPAFQLFLELGMKLEGVRRQFYFKNGKFINANLVSILRSEWKV